MTFRQGVGLAVAFCRGHADHRIRATEFKIPTLPQKDAGRMGQPAPEFNFALDNSLRVNPAIAERWTQLFFRRCVFTDEDRGERKNEIKNNFKFDVGGGFGNVVLG